VKHQDESHLGLVLLSPSLIVRETETGLPMMIEQHGAELFYASRGGTDGYYCLLATASVFVPFS